MLRDRATAIVRRLRDAGHQALFAGGCVRDGLLGIEPTDYDIATSARPEQVEDLFERTVPVGRRFGIIVVVDGEQSFEVATFRADGPYLDGRHPESVRFTTLEEDAERRDFTINAMFEDPLDGSVVDLGSGRADLEARIVRAVGEPAKRFAEDRLRMLRAVRFAARFGFDIDESTLTAVREGADKLTQVAAERIGVELLKILTEGAVRRAFELLDTSGLLAVILPEMLELKGCEQSADYHPEGDVFTHTLLCIEQLDPDCSSSLSLGLLLHDIAKPRCAAIRDGRHTFYGHCPEGAHMAEAICRRLRYSNTSTERVTMLVNQHLRHCSARQMKPSTLKRFLRQDGIGELLELARMDAMASSGDLTHYRYCMDQLAELSAELLQPPPLLSGHDLSALGLQPGPLFSEILKVVEDAQLDGTLRTHEQALELVRSRYL